MALLAALALAGLYALAAGGFRSSALYAFFVSPFASPYAFFSLLERAAPMLVCAAGASIALRSGAMNLGGEGQVAFGALASALAIEFLSGLGTSPLLAQILAFIAAMAAGAFLAWISAAAEKWSGADIMLTSFLLSQAAVIAVDWAVGTALREEGSNLLAMAPVPAAYRMLRLAPPSPLSAAAPIALFIAIASYLFLSRTEKGLEIELYGRNSRFARAIGIGSGIRKLAMAASGALGGFAGAFLVLGPAGRAMKGMTGGLGWDGLSAALVAGSDPLIAAPAALFFSWLDAGARQGSLLADLSPDAGAIMKSAALFLVTAAAIGGGSRRGAARGAAREAARGEVREAESGARAAAPRREEGTL